MYRSTLSQRQVLRGSPLFARLGDEETDHILAHARVAKYAAGDQIMVKGDPGDSMMAVLNGRVSISAPSPDGRHVVLSVLRDGNIFGEIALLDGKERTADVNAVYRLRHIDRSAPLTLVAAGTPGGYLYRFDTRLVRALAPYQSASRGTSLSRS